MLDFYHATEHLQVFADNSFPQEAERKPLCKQTRSALKKGKINSIIQHMNKLSLELSGERRKNLDREINYFIKGNKEGRFNYHKISILKLPIGSGAVESLIRQVVNLRIKGLGQILVKRKCRNRIKQVEQKLIADVVAPAEAECERAIARAKGNAASIIEDGKAQADGTKKLAESWQNAGSNAKEIFLLQKFDLLLKAMASSIPELEVEKVTIIDGSQGSNATKMASFIEQLR